ncbi:MAG: OmpA family protein [Bacteroidaceae bacterium]|nr:OmpA family protein [Bacteroidaceae bacterium]
MKKLILFALVAMTMTSCVSKKQYQEAVDAKNALQTKYDDLQGQYNSQALSLRECETNNKNYDRMLNAAQNEMKDLKTANAALQESLSSSVSTSGANISKLVDEINASNKYIQQLVEAKSKSDSLSIALTNKLTRSLSKEELKDVDVQVLKGVVYISLNDNMLYKSGSYEISQAAGETLSKIAKIITDYSDYEVLVEGNTDDVPISQKNIRNNWDLSCLRASSVVQELQNRYGVNPSRMTAGGRGEYNPLADNSTAEGRTRNRRTQIIITPQLDQFMELIDQAPASEE